MALLYDNTDLVWASRGDFVIGQNNDLMDTYADPLRSLYQEIRTRIMSDVGDWANYPNIGATLSDFVGEPNTKIVGESIKQRIQAALTRDTLVHNSDLSIKYMPIDVDKIMMRISIRVQPTGRNSGSETLTISLAYSYSENNVYFIK